MRAIDDKRSTPRRGTLWVQLRLTPSPPHPAECPQPPGSSRARDPGGAPVERALVARGEAAERRLPGALAHRGQPAAREPLARAARGRQARHRRGERVGVGGAEQAGAAVARSARAGPPSATATTGRPRACASRITWPNVSVRLAKRKHVGARVGARELVALEPAEERRVRRRGARAARPPRGRRRPARRCSRGSRARAAQERVGEQVGALLLGQAPGVEDVDASPRRSGRRRAAPGRSASRSTPRSQRPIRLGAMPSAAQRRRRRRRSARARRRTAP